MSAQSKIEWCDSTFNPWIGCTKVSPACDHCYAAVSTPARARKIAWGAGQPRQRTSAANWREPLRWNKHDGIRLRAWEGFQQQYPGLTDAELIERGFIKPKRRRVFCASLADVFDNEVDPSWRVDLLRLIAETPNLDWLLLTKRIGNAERLLDEALGVLSHGLTRWRDAPWPNVWLGATICNQAEADRDIPKLLATPARIRFLSIEPMLGPVDLTVDGLVCLPCRNAENMMMDPTTGAYECCRACDFTGIGDEWGIDWVIAGGESGHGARPMHPGWVRSLRDQCKAAEVPFLFKQWGEWAPHRAAPGGDEGGDLRRDHVRYLTGDGREPDGHFRKGDAAVARIGKKAAGRELDGETHDAFPDSAT